MAWPSMVTAIVHRRGRREGDAEVGDHGMAVRQQDVFGLYVTMYDAPFMRVVQRITDLGGDPQGIGQRQGRPLRGADLAPSAR